MDKVERRRGHAHRLEAGHTYFDLDQPERGPFVGTGDEEVAPNANIVAQDEVDEGTWKQLVSAGWGESKPGAGDRSYDQGAFGQEDDPRSDVMNAAPPGVGEQLTPRGPEAER